MVIRVRWLTLIKGLPVRAGGGDKAHEGAIQGVKEGKEPGSCGCH